MKKFQFLVVLVGVVFLLASPAAAVYWSDTYTPADPVYMTMGDTYDYTHNINDDGFNVWSDYVGWYKVDLSVSDDISWDFISDALFDWRKEYVEVSTGYFFWHDGAESYEVDFNRYDPITHEVVSRPGWLSLNTTGTLNVQLEGLGGDFYFFESVLTARPTKPVPEPGTIVLMGLGLVGLAGMGRKKLFKK